MIQILLRYWYALPIAFLAVALLLTRGTLAETKDELRGVKADFAQFQADVKAKTELARLRDAENKARVERDQNQVTTEVSDDYQKQLAALRARYDAVRVQLATKANPGSGRGSAVPSFPDAARGPDAGTADTGLPTEAALIASEQALQLRALQDWIRQQEAVNRENPRPSL